MFNKHDITRNDCQLLGGQAKCGYDWWWHSFTGRHAVTGAKNPSSSSFSFAIQPQEEIRPNSVG